MKQLVSIVSIIMLASCSRPTANTYHVDEAASTLEWKGATPDHFHTGSFKVTGSFQANSDGTVTGGDFVIPIASIENFDLQMPVKKVLLDDLTSANFFNLVLHPEARFHVTKSLPFNTSDTSAVADANYMLTGDFTMLGQTHPISFPAKIHVVDNRVYADAKLKLDRTKWGMTIYSDPAQKLYIYPEVDLTLKINTDQFTPAVVTETANL